MRKGDYRKILRSYKTLWQKANRDRKRLIKIKGLVKKIDNILDQVKEYDSKHNQQQSKQSQSSKENKK